MLEVQVIRIFLLKKEKKLSISRDTKLFYDVVYATLAGFEQQLAVLSIQPCGKDSRGLDHQFPLLLP